MNVSELILKMSGVNDEIESKKLLEMMENSKDYETAVESYKKIKDLFRKNPAFYEAQFFRLLKVYYDPYLKSRVQEVFESDSFPDIPGDLHVHTTYSDGVNTIEEMVKYAVKLGYKYIAITDHTLLGKGRVQMDLEKFFNELSEIERIQEKYDIKILKSAEVDVNEDGSLDYPEEILKSLDFVLVSIHFDFGLGVEKVLELFEKVAYNQDVDIIAHPFNKIGIEGFKKYGEKIIELIEENNKTLEFNLFPDRIKENDFLLELIKDRKTKISFSTDSHRKEHLEFMRLANLWIEEIDKSRIFNFLIS